MRPISSPKTPVRRPGRARSMLLVSGALAALLALGAISFDRVAIAGPDDVSDSQVQKWIDDLGADDFRTREQASEQLAALGSRAETLLKKAAKDSSSLEVRWRAEQLLRARKKAAQPAATPKRKVIPAEPRSPAPSPRAGEKGDPFKSKRDNPLGQPEVEDTFRKRMEELKRQLEKYSGGSGMGGLEDLDRAIEEMQKKWPEIMRHSMDETMERLNSLLDGRGSDPRSLFGFGSFGPRVVSVEGLTLRNTAPGQFELQVRPDGQPTTPAKVYKGSSLKDILAHHPELASHPQMDALKTRMERRHRSSWPGFVSIPRLQIRRNGQPGSVSIQIHSGGVEIQEDANGARVRIRERDENGKERVKEYTGESIEAIKKEHPEIANRLGGTTFEIRPPQMFGPSAGQQWLRAWRSRSAPRPATVRPNDPRGGAHAPRARLGAQVSRPHPAFASQLGLAEGAGAIVVHVLPGTPAADMGLLKHDIIVSVNGKSVDNHAHLGGLVAPHLAKGKTLTLELIRGGNRMTISR